MTGRTTMWWPRFPRSGTTEHTISFPPVTAKFFRVTFKTLPATDIPTGSNPDELGITTETADGVCDRGVGAASGSACQPVRREGRLQLPCRTSTQFATPPVDCRRCHRQVRRDRSDLEDARRRHARLDAARRQLGRPALRLFPARNHQPSGHRRGHGPGSRQAEPQLM